MNTYRPPMGGYKSPIKKISTAGTKIASAASSVIQNARSPPKQQQQQTMSAQKRSGVGIRDRINKFDSACRYNASASPAPFRVHVSSYNKKLEEQSSPFNPNYRPEQAADTTANAHQTDMQGDIMEIEQTDKENTRNFASPSRHRKIKHKLQETFSPITERDHTVKAIQKAKETFSPITKRMNEEKVKMQSVFSPNKKRTSESTSKQTKSIFSPPREQVHTEADSPSPIKYGEESELRKRVKQLEAENKMLETTNQSLTHQCQVLTRENQRLESSQAVVDEVGSKPNKRNQTNMKVSAKKRHSNEHPLISSPLRNHVLAVKEASETNSFISVRKEPFALFPPEYQYGNGRAAEKGGEYYLGNLGALTGNAQHRGSNDATRGDDLGDTREKRKFEEDMDLLNAAAFLFKTSRRRLN